MNKQQYINAHRLVRLLRYEQQLESVFHYPIGFDCPCGGADDCDSCADESVERTSAYEALVPVKSEIAKLLSVVDRESLPVVASTLKPNYKVYIWGCELGEYFQSAVIDRLARGERGMAYWDKKNLFEWWMDSIKQRRHEDKLASNNIRDMQHALTHRRAHMEHF